MSAGRGIEREWEGEMALGFDEGVVDAASSCRQENVASNGRQLGVEVARSVCDLTSHQALHRLLKFIL